MIHDDIQSHARIGMASKKVRLRDPETGLYLHFSGHGTTQGTTWAWSGTPQQAANMRRAARERGEQFPYRRAALNPPGPTTEPDRYGNPTSPRSPITDRATSSSQGAA